MKTEQSIERSKVKNLKLAISGIGMKYGVFFILVTLCQIGLTGVIAIKKDMIPEEYKLILVYVILIISVYAIGYPFLRFLFRKDEISEIEQHDLGIARFIRFFLYMVGILGIGVVIGQLFDHSIKLILDISDSSTNTAKLIENTNIIYTAITAGLLGPVFEELIFRKLLVDHCVKYGKGMAIVMSGIMFSLFHGSLTQFFYTMGVGMLFAYIYVETGKIKYSIILHVINNMTASVLLVQIMKIMNKSGLLDGNVNDFTDLSFEMLACFIVLITIFVILVVGMIYLIVSYKKILSLQKKYNFKSGFYIILTSVGMWLFIVPCLISIVSGYLK